MTISEAKKAVLAEWKSWSAAPNIYNIIKFREFADWLEKERPAILTYKVRPGVDRYQDVLGWLRVYTEQK